MSLNARDLAITILNACKGLPYPLAQQTLYTSAKSYIESNIEFEGSYTGAIGPIPDSSTFAGATFSITPSIGPAYTLAVDHQVGFLANQLVTGFLIDLSSNKVILNSPLIGVGNLIPASFDNSIEADTEVVEIPTLKIATAIVKAITSGSVATIGTSSTAGGKGQTIISGIK